MDGLKLFMVLAGCRPPGRNTEQHDIFFGIGKHIRDILPDLFLFWPEAKTKIHLDAWREVTAVDGHNISVKEKGMLSATPKSNFKLYFINLGGYKTGEFEEFHYKMLTVAETRSIAIANSKQTAFYKHTGLKGAPSHIDDKFGIDVDDIAEIKDILPARFKKLYTIEISPGNVTTPDELHLGYMPVNKL